MIDIIIEYAPIIIVILIGIVNFVRTGNIRKSIECMHIVAQIGEEMKYRTENYKETEGRQQQKFSEYKPEYILNSNTNELEKVEGKGVNIQEAINSALPTALEQVLQKYMPIIHPTTGELAQPQPRITRSTKLDLYTKYYSYIESLRDEFNLPDDMSAEDILIYVNEQGDKLDKKIQEYKGDVNNG